MLRRLAAFAAVAVLASTGSVLGAAPASASACPLDWYCSTIYYASATDHTVVGAKHETCTGNVSRWGVTTGVYDYYRDPC